MILVLNNPSYRTRTPETSGPFVDSQRACCPRGSGERRVFSLSGRQQAAKMLSSASLKGLFCVMTFNDGKVNKRFF